MEFCRVFHKLLVLFGPILGLLSSCRGGINYEVVNLDSLEENVQIIESTSGDNGEFIPSSEIEFLYTISKLEKEGHDVYQRKHLYNPLDYENSKLKMLVLPVHFTDGVGTSSYDRNEIKADLMTTFKGPKEDTNWESLHSFYYASSNGLIDFDITFGDYYLSQKSSNEVNSLDKTIELLNNALANLTIKGEKVDLSEFDGNGDGVIDSIWVIYDVKDYMTSGSKNENLWNYTYPIYNSGKSNPYNVGVFSFGSYDLMHKGANNGIALDAHTFIHETGHMFGLNDYYDYEVRRAPMCAVTMMDKNIGDFDAYSKLILGWTKPIITYGYSKINKKTLLAGQPLVVLPNESKIYKYEGKYYFNPFDEYLVAEYYDLSKNSLNYQDLFNGNDAINLAPLSGEVKDSYKVYHVNNKLIDVNASMKGELKYLDSPNISGKVLRLFQNTSRGNDSHSEKSILNSLGITNYPSDISDYNEVTWISKYTTHTNSYDTLYIYEDEESGGRALMNLDAENSFFNPGDTFKTINYGNYFKNGPTVNGAKGDLGATFSTEISFW